jgi:hypothetical protein
MYFKYSPDYFFWGEERLVVGFITACVIGAHHH